MEVAPVGRQEAKDATLLLWSGLRLIFIKLKEPT